MSVIIVPLFAYHVHSPFANPHDLETRNTRQRTLSSTTTTDAYPDELYRDAADESDVNAFLNETDYYDSARKMRSIPEPTDTANT